MKFLLCWFVLAFPVQLPLPEYFYADLVATLVRLELCNEKASDISIGYGSFSNQIRNHRIMYASLKNAPSLALCAELPDCDTCQQACIFYSERMEYCRKQRVVFPSADWPGFDSFQSDARKSYDWWVQARIATNPGRSTLERRLALQAMEEAR